MIWEEALDEAKDELNVRGYTKNWDEVIKLAHSIQETENRKIAKGSHRNYLNSDEWRNKRKKILARDNFQCKWCKEIIDNLLRNNYGDNIFQDKNFYKLKSLITLIKIFNGTNIYVPANEVHHLDYQFLHTINEEKYCVSLCNFCHRIAHSSTKYQKEFLEKAKYENMFYTFLIRLKGLKEYVKCENQLKSKKEEDRKVNPSKFLNNGS